MLPGRDFGVAFYTTTNLTQAIKFANDTYRTMRALHVNNNVSHPNPVHAAVIEYTIDRDALGSLASLSFVLANDDWREFVIHCRKGGTHRPPGTDYDMVIGPVSNMYYAAWPGYDQLSFNSDAAIRRLVLTRVALRGKPTL